MNGTLTMTKSELLKFLTAIPSEAKLTISFNTDLYATYPVSVNKEPPQIKPDDLFPSINEYTYRSHTDNFYNSNR